MEISHEIQDAEECLEKDATFEVGVIEAGGDYSEVSVVNEVTKKWVYSGPAKKISSVFLNLDMEKKSLEVLPERSIRRKVFHLEADSVFPFFSVNCPHCSLTFCEMNSWDWVKQSFSIPI